MENKKMGKIEWLSILQGWSMLLVVIGHATLTKDINDPAYYTVDVIQSFVYSFHMQLFMLISGWLFYFSAIRKDKSYKEVIVSKLKRLGIPFLVFSLATTILKLLMSPFVKRPVDATEIIDTFVFFKSNPLLEMWFVVALFILMSAYPIYQYVLKRNIRMIMLGGIFLILFLSFSKIDNYFQMKRVAQMGLFFYVGILSCKYNWVDLLKNRAVLIVSLLVCIGFQYLKLPLSSMYNLITIFSGIIFSFSLCLILSNNSPKLFSIFRDYTYQIFLLGIFFQMSVTIIYNQIEIKALYCPMYLLSIILGLYLPVVISKFVIKLDNHFLRLCLGL